MSSVMRQHDVFLERRDIAQRLVIKGELELTSPAHLGCGRDDVESDQPLVTDQEDGLPYLPGTTLAGLLRHQLDTDEAIRLFGPHSQSDDDSEQSRLLFSDSPVVNRPSTELREGVAIEGKTGVARDKTKYDFELLSVGTKFSLRFELLLPAEPAPASRLKALTGRLLTLLEDGRVCLGARSRRGFGDCRIISNGDGVHWHVEKYDVTSLAGLMAWMGAGEPESVGLKSGREWSLEQASAASKDFEITAKLRVQGGVLIGSGGHGADEADKSHLHRRTSDGGLEPILAGTSLAGVLRHRCLKILNTLGKQSSFVEAMFGSQKCASKLRVWEVPIQGGRTLRHSRVRIDPWTGGAAETALYTQDVHYGGEVEVRVSVRDPLPAQQALLLLALRDLAEGELRIGGQSGAGRGRLAPACEGEFAEIVSDKGAAKLIYESGRVKLQPDTIFEAEFEALRDLP